MRAGVGEVEKRHPRFHPYPAYKPSGVEWLGEVYGVISAGMERVRMYANIAGTLTMSGLVGAV